MHLIFTKGPHKHDRLDVIRDHGPPESIEQPKQRIIPHDMVHYVVEHALQYAGFLSRVQAGTAASFQMQAEPHSDAVERLVEVIQGDAWSGAQAPADELIELYGVTCTARGCPPLPITPAQIDHLRARMAELTRQWAAVPVGGSLRLEF